MSDVLTPEEIYKQVFFEKLLTKEDAIARLFALLENSENPELRIRCLKTVKDIELRSDEVFDTLENQMISDESYEVRVAAADSLGYLFPQRGLESRKWAEKNYLFYELPEPILLNAKDKPDRFWMEQRFDSETIKKIENYLAFQEKRRKERMRNFFK